MAHFNSVLTSARQVSLGRIPIHAGFSLLEVMVTLIILSFGLLGVAGLLVRGVSNASASESMAKASMLAADMADRIRANAAVAVATDEYLTSYSDTAPVNPTTVAQSDKKAWLDALSAQIQQGDGQITRSANSVRGLNINVRWNNCQGTLSESDHLACKSNSANAFKGVTYELRL